MMKISEEALSHVALPCAASGGRMAIFRGGVGISVGLASGMVGEIMNSREEE